MEMYIKLDLERDGKAQRCKSRGGGVVQVGGRNFILEIIPLACPKINKCLWLFQNLERSNFKYFKIVVGEPLEGVGGWRGPLSVRLSIGSAL